MPAATALAHAEPIRRGEIYTHQEARKRAGWGRAAWRSAIKGGLKVIRTAGRCYVSGDALCDYLQSLEGQG